VSPLANAIHAVLRSRVPTTGDPRIAYGDLIAAIRDGGFSDMSLASGEGNNTLRKALEEIVDECRSRSLPCLVALIVQSDRGRLGYPGGGYFSYVHPDVKDKEVRLVLWAREVEAVKKTTYPED
jgi:hypothetical protein